MRIFSGMSVIFSYIDTVVLYDPEELPVGPCSSYTES